MKTIRVTKTLERDGEIHVTGLPFKKGDNANIIFMVKEEPAKEPLLAKQLLESGLVGLWADHDDIKDSSEYARALRGRLLQISLFNMQEAVPDHIDGRLRLFESDITD